MHCLKIFDYVKQRVALAERSNFPYRDAYKNMELTKRQNF